MLPTALRHGPLDGDLDRCPFGSCQVDDPGAVLLAGEPQQMVVFHRPGPGLFAHLVRPHGALVLGRAGATDGERRLDQLLAVEGDIANVDLLGRSDSPRPLAGEVVSATRSIVHP